MEEDSDHDYVIICNQDSMKMRPGEEICFITPNTNATTYNNSASLCLVDRIEKAYRIASTATHLVTWACKIALMYHVGGGWLVKSLSLL
jgi:hypothetical protein